MAKDFAGFIMTYERHDLIARTINQILSQSFPPEKLLVVDNSVSTRTEEIIRALNDPRVGYYRVGENAGPAGAAYHGIRLLSAEGFRWIYWGDDDDPPRDLLVFERLLSIPGRVTDHRVGAVGLMGNRFDFSRGRFVRLTNRELKGIVEVDAIAGNNTLIISGDAARACELPDRRLFFGLEELDYCTTLKKGGFRLFVDGDLYFEQRKKANKHENEIPVSRYDNLSFDIRSKSLWREYYSIRNLIFIIAHKERRPWTVFTLVAKYLGKAALSFRRGLKFGGIYTKLTVSAIFDGLFKKMGRKYVPGSITV